MRSSTYEYDFANDSLAQAQLQLDLANLNYNINSMWGSLDFSSPNYLQSAALENYYRIQRETNRAWGIKDAWEIEYEAHQQVLEKADSVISRCHSAEIKDPSEKKYLNELANYLQKRKTEWLGFFESVDEQHAQVKERTTFITKIVDAVLNHDYKAEFKLLSEENIKPFKGLWSKRLYNLLHDRRIALEANEKLLHGKGKPKLNTTKESIKEATELTTIKIKF